MAINLLSLCDPSRYERPPLDVPTFYQRAARDPRINLFHVPAQQVLTQMRLDRVQVAPAQGDLSYPAFLALGDHADQWRSLQEIDVVFCRTLKPFPPGYLDQLCVWENHVQFVNSPSGKQHQLQPEYLLQVARDWIPEAVVTEDEQEALAFFEQHQVIVGKRFNSCGGSGVFKIWHESGCFWADNIHSGTQSYSGFQAVLDQVRGNTGKPVQLMRYLSRVDQGDKRIVVVDGEIYGAYLRRSRRGHWVNNVSQDGECWLAEVTDLEREAIAATVPQYRAQGLHTLGYDFLQDQHGDWRISEINAGNIGGFARLELLTQRPIMTQFLSWLIEYAQTSHSRKAVVTHAALE